MFDYKKVLQLLCCRRNEKVCKLFVQIPNHCGPHCFHNCGKTVGAISENIETKPKEIYSTLNRKKSTSIDPHISEYWASYKMEKIHWPNWALRSFCWHYKVTRRPTKKTNSRISGDLSQKVTVKTSKPQPEHSSTKTFTSDGKPRVLM